MMKPWLKIAIFACALSLAAPAARAQRVEFPSPASSFGTVPASPGFDPYAIPAGTPPMSAPALPPAGVPYAPPPAYGTPAPYTSTPGAIYPEGAPVYTGQPFESVTTTWTQTMRFFQELHVDETWLARGGGEDALGINTINTWAAFAVPFFGS
ncbi:MAG TPA: hypothetical protein VGJ15_11945 [Pirellulales bacterium]